jgi:translation elongation factor EF-G
MDMLVEQTHAIRHEMRANERPMCFTDTRMDEQQRGVSLKMVPMSLVLAGGSGKSYLLNLIDTPGAPPGPCAASARDASARAAPARSEACPDR